MTWIDLLMILFRARFCCEFCSAELGLQRTPPNFSNLKNLLQFQNLFNTMSAQLRAAIYGSPRASFGPGYPTKLEAMQHYMWCLEVENSDKKNALNRLAENLRVQWSNMPDPKPVLEMAQVRDKFKTMLKDYWSLTNLGFEKDSLHLVDCRFETTFSL